MKLSKIIYAFINFIDFRQYKHSNETYRVELDTLLLLHYDTRFYGGGLRVPTQYEWDLGQRHLGHMFKHLGTK